MKTTLREKLEILAFDAIRAVVYVVVFLIVVLGFQGATGNTPVTTLKYTQATACELAIPSNPQTGRDPAKVALCFTQQGLPSPNLVTP